MSSSLSSIYQCPHHSHHGTDCFSDDESDDRAHGDADDSDDRDDDNDDGRADNDCGHDYDDDGTPAGADGEDYDDDADAAECAETDDGSWIAFDPRLCAVFALWADQDKLDRALIGKMEG